MIKIITFSVFVAACLTPAHTARDFMLLYQGHSLYINRLTQLMRTFYVKLDERITNLNNIKFKYESSMQFEQGYLMGVIIEKYRHSVEQTKMSERVTSFKVNDLLLRLELVQRVYVDIYRMVNMMHEVPRKYGWDIRKRKRSTVKGNPKELIIAIKSLKRKELSRKKKRRFRLKELKKMREAMQQAGENLTMSPRTPRNTKQWWEYEEYGWEIAEDYRPEW